MKTLVDYIKENLEIKEDISNEQDIKWKVDSWMSERPEEKQAFDAVLSQWQTNHQVDDHLLQSFCDKTDVREFVNFVSDDVKGQNAHDNDFEIVKNILKLY